VVPAPRYLIGLALTLVGAALLCALLWLARIERNVARGDVGLKCGRETHRVRRHAGHRMLAKLVDERMKRQKCVRCGWSGLAI
jgi:hypothetical protein